MFPKAWRVPTAPLEDGAATWTVSFIEAILISGQLAGQLALVLISASSLALQKSMGLGHITESNVLPLHVQVKMEEESLCSQVRWTAPTSSRGTRSMPVSKRRKISSAGLPMARTVMTCLCWLATQVLLSFLGTTRYLIPMVWGNIFNCQLSRRPLFLLAVAQTIRNTELRRRLLASKPHFL